VRLYGTRAEEQAGAQHTLYHVLLTTLKLFAPFLPFVTDEIYEVLFSTRDGATSIHVSRWPEPDPRFEDEASEALGETLLAIATAVRRYKSENSLSLGTEIAHLQLFTDDDKLSAQLREAHGDLGSVTRARQITIEPKTVEDFEMITITSDGAVGMILSPR
jgi:valyl-tRNA synthetase